MANHEVLEKRPPLIISWRFLLSILCFFLNAIHYMQRVNLSVAIVCMVSHKKVDTGLVTDRRTILIGQKKYRGYLLSAVFVGALFSQIIGGWLSIKFGGKVILLISVASASLFTLITPFSAHFGYVVLLIIRFLIGFLQGLVSSAMTLLWVEWAPPNERSILLSVSNSGSLIGNAFTFVISGYLCVESMFAGWPSIFYFTGFAGIVWSIFWVVLVSDSPSDHKFITSLEKNYLLEKTSDCTLSSIQNKDIPWKSLMLSKPVIGLIITTLSANFGISLFVTCLPIYMNEVLNFNIKLNGELSSIPFLTCMVFILVSAVISDKIIQKGKIDKIKIRKCFNSLGFFIPCITFVGLIFISESSRVLGFILILINTSFSGFAYGAGYLVNFNDIGGAYSGMIYGIAHTLGSFTSILAPFLVGLITANKTSEGWHIIFIIASSVYFIATITFLITGSSETQSWAKIDNNVELDEK